MHNDDFKKSLKEGDLEINLPDYIVAHKKFDNGKEHGLSHCMKAVDFIIELPEKLIFIEFKDPDNPSAVNNEAFIKQLNSQELMKIFYYKYRDSWLYEWASGRINKPVYYYVLIAMQSLSDADLMTQTENLKRQLPLLNQNSEKWKQFFVMGCGIMNLASWNKHFPDFFIRRISNLQKS